MIALQVVNDSPAQTVEDVIEGIGKFERAHGTELMAGARLLASQTINLIRAQKDPATLASVALAISDQRFKILYLEEVGRALI